MEASNHIALIVGGRTLWEAWPKQDEWLSADEFEILAGGARGPGKTAAGIVWLLLGNQVPTGTVADSGYYKHPNYRALVLRKNVNDMSDWIAKAKQIYGPLGAEYTNRPPEFKWKNGGTIIIGHLDDEDAYEKYQGQEYARILIEELTQIPSKDLYIKVMASCRCAFDELKCQIFLTANPGGPGHSWVRERFVVPAPAGERFTDPETGLTRIFIPGRVRDNPIYADDRQYLGQLMSLSPAMRRAWLEGDWDAIAGQYFDEFRIIPNEALGEPETARHVIASTEAKLPAWYHRWLSCDWGYTHNAAVYKFCAEPNGRVHITDELVANRTTPEELGLAIGQFIWTDLNQSSAQRSWQLFLSPDAFGRRTDERTIADQLATGLEKILGTNSVYILPPASDQGSDIFSRAALQGSASVVIQRAANQRIPGWMHMKALMRWWSITPTTDDNFDPAMALKLYQESPAKCQEYMGLFNQGTEILPKLAIHGDKCPKLVRAIPLARANDPDKGDPEDIKKTDGDDEIDAARYGLFAQKFMQVVEPFEVFFANHMARFAPGTDLEKLDGNSKVMMARKAEALYAEKTGANAKPIYFPRSRARAARAREKQGATKL